MTYNCPPTEPIFTPATLRKTLQNFIKRQRNHLPPIASDHIYSSISYPLQNLHYICQIGPKIYPAISPKPIYTPAGAPAARMPLLHQTKPNKLNQTFPKTAWQKVKKTKSYCCLARRKPMPLLRSLGVRKLRYATRRRAGLPPHEPPRQTR